MGSRTLTDRLYALHVAGLPIPPVSGGEPTPGETPPAVTPTPTPAPAPTTPTPVVNDTTTMLLSELTSTRTRVAELEQAERNRLAEAARKEQDLLAEKGNTEAAKQALQKAREDHEKEVATANGRLAEETRRSRTAFRDRDLATELANFPLVPGAAPQLIKLLRDELDAQADGEGYAVRTKDFLSTKDFLAREMAKPENAHFLRPTTQGGGGASGGNTPAPTPAASGTPPDRMAENLKLAVNRARAGAPGLGGNFGLPITYKVGQN